MITDPYQVLHISPDATDDEVRKAYRELARKYHPDHYQGSDLEHMAEEKMKEINEAYAMIQKMRKSGGTGAAAGSGYAGYGGGYRQSSASQNPLFQQIRMAIQHGDLDGAERMLQSTDLRTAEWHFLMGSLHYRRGWLDEALREFEMAYGMEPDNMEYRQACQYMRGGGTAYRPEGYGSGGMMHCDPCQAMICAGALCTVCTGGRLHICCC